MNQQATEHWHDIETSATVSGCGWGNNTLYVNFKKNGKYYSTYAYTTTDKTLCCKLSMADSPGQFVHRYLNSLPYARIH